MAHILSQHDVHFLLFEWLKIEELLDAPRYAEHDRETLIAVLDLAEKLAEQYFQPVNRKADQEEPILGPDGRVILPHDIGNALTAFLESGLLTASQGPDVGGM